MLLAQITESLLRGYSQLPFLGGKLEDMISRDILCAAFPHPTWFSGKYRTIHHDSDFSDPGEPSLVLALGQQSLTRDPPVALMPAEQGLDAAHLSHP